MKVLKKMGQKIHNTIFDEQQLAQEKIERQRQKELKLEKQQLQKQEQEKQQAQQKQKKLQKQQQQSNQKTKKHQFVIEKVNCHEIYNKENIKLQLENGQQPPILNSELVENQRQQQSDWEFNRYREFSTILNQQTVNYQDLQKKSWNGIPQVFRSLVWRIILHYMPTNKLIADEVLDKKRSEYWQQVDQYYLDIEELDDKEKYMRKIVLKDVPRTQPDYEIFKHPRVQEMLQRILYVWNVRHPACGYVQGMNEIVTVFIVVFLQEYVQLNQETFEIPDNIHNVKREEWDTVEADSYWCLSRILDKIQDNYTHGQPGIKKCLDKMEQVVTKLDPELIAVFKNQHVQFVQFAFRWVLCLLIREIPLPQALRLFDTYISDEQGFQNLHIYVCAATLLQYSKTLQKQNFNEIIMFLQNIPTKDLKQQDIELLIQQGYVYQQMYDQSQGHIKKTVNLEWL